MIASIVYKCRNDIIVVIVKIIKLKFILKKVKSGLNISVFIDFNKLENNRNPIKLL